MLLKNHLKSLLKKGTVLFLTLVFLVSSSNVIYAEDDTKEITVRYYDDNSRSMVEFVVPYSDSYFVRDDNTFYIDLARASIGMNESAFRDGKDEGALADDNIKSFFKQAEFDNYESYWYDKEPTANSIASAIASKQIGDETIVAVICCGKGYKDEWLSNLTVGNGIEHAGFLEATNILEDRVNEYLEKYGIDDNAILWISGFSRAAAVGNLFAARMNESDVFNRIYAYFYATPNNTRDPIAYPNIFNVISQNDPVAQTPLTAWGYGRNGNDLYLPAQEYNSDFLVKMLLANDVMEEINGQSYRNNPDLNRQLHVVFEYLARIFPTVDDFCNTLQPQLISAYEEHKGSDLIVLLREALKNINSFSPVQQEAVNSLMSYLDKIIYEYVSGNDKQMEDGSWNDDSSLGANIVLEHASINYISWLFSADDPDELFVDITKTTRLVIKGDFDLEIYDDQGIVQSISSTGEEKLYLPGLTLRPEGADFIYLYVENSDGLAIVNLPGDRDYSIKLNVLDDDTLSLFTNEYVYGDLNNDVGNIILFEADKDDVVTIGDFRSNTGFNINKDDEHVAVVKQELSSNIESVVARELLMSGGYSVTNIFILGGIVAFVPIILLLIIGVLYLLRKKHNNYLAITILFGIIALIYVAGFILLNKMLNNILLASLIPGIMAIIFTAIFIIRLVKLLKKHQSKC